MRTTHFYRFVTCKFLLLNGSIFYGVGCSNDKYEKPTVISSAGRYVTEEECTAQGKVWLPADPLTNLPVCGENATDWLCTEGNVLLRFKNPGGTIMPTAELEENINMRKSKGYELYACGVYQLNLKYRLHFRKVDPSTVTGYAWAGQTLQY